MSIDRRQALGLITLSAAPSLSLAAEPSAVAFIHGVASGDPLSDRVILWTRVEAKGRVQVAWEIAETKDFKAVVAKGAVSTGPERDHTVKVDATGLRAGRDYWYRFKAGQAVSPVGRARTLPVGALDKAVLAFVSCSLYPAGYFNAYDHIARLERVDAVVCLGDYIYEYGAAPGDYGMEIGARLGRAPEPAHEILSLADYRARHSLYKRDTDLQAAHARAAWICVWDDHEVADDSWVGGAHNHQPKTEGSWLGREAAALQAYYEWMPIREPQPGRAFEAINRSFDFGDLASLVMVETRLVSRSFQLEYSTPGDIPLAVYSSADPATRTKVTDPVLAAQAMQAAAKGQPLPAGMVIGPDPERLNALIADPERQMMGARQELWLGETLAASAKAGRPWQVLGNQVVMARMRGPNVFKAFGPTAVDKLLASLSDSIRPTVANLASLFSFDLPYDLDGWDGYPAARERTYQAIKAAEGNVLVVSGDSHAFWANELSDASGALVAVEFGASGITSPSNGDAVPAVDLGKLFVDQNPEVKFCDQRAKGYVLLTLTREAANAELVAVEQLVRPYTAKTLARFRVRPAPGPGPGRLETV
jgi:alkaline phosphatase D